MYVGNKSYGWSDQNWDRTMSLFSTGTEITDTEQALYGMKIPPREPWEVKTGRVQRVCVTIHTPKAQDYDMSGRIYLAVGDCFEGFSEAPGQTSNQGWEIPANKRTSCFFMKFNDSDTVEACDMAYFGFVYGSGNEGTRVQFFLTYRWDQEDLTY